MTNRDAAKWISDRYVEKTVAEIDESELDIVMRMAVASLMSEIDMKYRTKRVADFLLKISNTIADITHILVPEDAENDTEEQTDT